MHDKTLVDYIKERSCYGCRMDCKSEARKFYVFNICGPDTFNDLKFYIMKYFEDSGYRCSKDIASFDPSARSLQYKDSDNRVALTVDIIHELFGNEREMGRAQVIVKRRR
jgi:hypothetical protein